MRILFAILLFPAILAADHLPANLIARGDPESILCGIDVNHTRVSELMEKLGKPQIYEKYPKTKDAAEITWSKNGSKIHAFINVDDVAYAVEVSGAATPIAATGRGLRLGGKTEELEQIYGNRFATHGSRRIFQWENGTEMRVTIVNGRVNRLVLVAPVE
jgi:hypothetical protein